MTNDPQNDSKSLGRNIFAENKAPLNTQKEETKKVEEQQPAKEKSIGRNMFAEPSKSQVVEGANREFDIIENTTLTDKKQSKKKIVKSSGKSKKINAIHITDENIVFAQTYYDGSSYKLINLQVIQVELPKLTEENVFKEKEDPEIAIKRIQLEAIDKVFKRAGVAKDDSLIVSALSGKNIIVKEVFIKNTPEENIELELPSILPSPFDAFSKYEYEVLSTTGADHRG